MSSVIENHKFVDGFFLPVEKFNLSHLTYQLRDGTSPEFVLLIKLFIVTNIEIQKNTFKRIARHLIRYSS